jgi:hypothetical protein
MLTVCFLAASLGCCISSGQFGYMPKAVSRHRKAMPPVVTQLIMKALQKRMEQGRKETRPVQEGVQPQQGALFSSQGDDSGISHATNVPRSGTSNALYFMPMPVATIEQLQNAS